MTNVSSAFVADPDLLRQLETRAKPIAVGPDHIIFRQGEEPFGLYILRKGIASLTRESKGEPTMQVLAGEGSLLGLPAVIATKPYSLTAEALDGAELSLLSRSDFNDLMRADPLLSFQLLKVLAEEVRFAREAITHS